MVDDGHTIDTGLELIGGNTIGTSNLYPNNYKTAVFWIWWKAGKPGARGLRGLIEPNPNGILPSVTVLATWIYKDFTNRAIEVDDVFNSKMSEIAVQEKVEMLERHTQLGKFMQDTAKEYLVNHKDELKPHTALRMLVDGIEIERKSLGLPGLIAELADTSDEALLKKFEKLLNTVDKDDLDLIEEGGDGVSDM